MEILLIGKKKSTTFVEGFKKKHNIKLTVRKIQLVLELKKKLT